jgi:hypothetical protein
LASHLERAIAPAAWAGHSNQECTMSKIEGRKVGTSRRSVLAGLAVAGTPTSALVVPSGDHELLALGERLEALLPELTAAQSACFAAADAADEEAWRRAGLYEHHDGMGGGDPLTREERSRLWAMGKVVRAEFGTEDAIRACNEVWQRANTIHREIIAQPARTLRGLAIKARAAAVLAVSPLWDKPAKDLDWHDEVVRKLIESICDAAGTPNWPPRSPVTAAT